MASTQPGIVLEPHGTVHAVPERSQLKNQIKSNRINLFAASHIHWVVYKVHVRRQQVAIRHNASYVTPDSNREYIARKEKATLGSVHGSLVPSAFTGARVN